MKKREKIIIGIVLFILLTSIMVIERNRKLWLSDSRHSIFKDTLICIEVGENDIVDAEYIRLHINGDAYTKIHFNSNTDLLWMNDGFLSDLADYMEENSYILKAGKYRIYKNSMFVDGKVLRSDGIKMKVLKFEKKQEEVIE